MLIHSFTDFISDRHKVGGVICSDNENSPRQRLGEHNPSPANPAFQILFLYTLPVTMTIPPGIVQPPKSYFSKFISVVKKSLWIKC
ncbi:hypothetical protein SATMO3_26740 [Sporomusa aerivorans]